MKERYNLLWIDDLYEELGGFIEEANIEGFDITPFSSSRDGMQHLERNLSSVDAVILDAKVFKDGPDDVPSEKGLTASIKEINRISGKNQGKEIPYLIYTGQPDLEDDDEFAERMDEIPVFSKNQNSKDLFEKLRELVRDSPDAAVRNQFRAAYDACGRELIDPKCWKLLAPVLRSITHAENLPADPYNDVRKALEWIFRYLHRNSVVHEKLIDDKGIVILQLTSLFLAGEKAFHHSGVTLSAVHKILPKLLGDTLKFVLDVTQPGSHTEELEDANAEKASIEHVAEFGSNHHLIQLVAIMTADLAEWAVNYVKANPDPDANRSLWVESPTTVSDERESVDCEGVVDNKDKYGNYFVCPKDLAETNNQNVRIRAKLIKSESPIQVGYTVSTISKAAPNKNYREATSYEVLS